jgi:hypothetical protein
MGTAMQKERLFSMEYYNAVHSYICGELNGFKAVRLRFESLKKLYLHYYLSIGDYSIGRLLAQCIDRGSMRDFSRAASEMMGY